MNRKVLGLTTLIGSLVFLISYSKGLYKWESLTQKSLTSSNVSLDAHYHFDIIDYQGEDFESEYKKLKLHLVNNKIDKIFILAGSYDSWKSRNRETQIIIEAVSRNPDQIIGFCGVDLSAENLNEITEYTNWCLQHPNMRGIKLHFYTSLICLSKSSFYRERLSQYLEHVKKVSPIVLLHLKNSSDCDSFRETQTFYQVARRFPKITFIIAHAYGHLDWIGKQLRKEEVTHPNIYTEISTNEESFSNQLMVSNLREFGMERVLFGSDNIDPSINRRPDLYGSDFVPLIVAIQNSQYLTKDEKEMILRTNGKRFVELVKQ